MAVTSGGESCRSSTASDTASEPSSPSRPITPQPMPPVPPHFSDHCPYECLRLDSEDSGLGTSPAKSLVGPASPDGYISPIQFVPDMENEVCDAEEEERDHSDSLLDLRKCRDNFTTHDEGSRAQFPKFCVPDPSDSDNLGKDNVDVYKTTNDSIDKFHFNLSSNVSESGKVEDICSKMQFDISVNKSSDSVNCSNSKLSLWTSNDTAGISDHPFCVSSPSVCSPKHSELTESSEFLSPLPPKFCKVASSFTSICSPSRESQTQDCCESSSNNKPLDCHFTLTSSSSVTDIDTVDANSESKATSKYSVPKVSIDGTEEEAFHFRNSVSNPKVVLVRTDYRLPHHTREPLECEESRESLCSEPNQGRSSDMCHELTSDCTSSSCSQTNSDTHNNSQDDGICKWINCNHSTEDNAPFSNLIDHIRQCHVHTQGVDDGIFTCRWIGCKVYDRPSSSRSWLERHILLHGGSKPFRCIVDGCNQRFSTEGILQRHVNSHFPQSRSGSARANDHSIGRLCKRRRLKCRRRYQSVKRNDFFDDGIMEHVRHSLFQMSSVTGMDTDGPPRTITFHSTIIARRVEASGKVKVLLHWSPEEVLPDCWVSETDAASKVEQVIPVSSLPPEKLVCYDPIYAAQQNSRNGKRRRK